jgi:hypothetical protein
MITVLLLMLPVAAADEPQKPKGLHQRGIGVHGYDFAAGNLVTEAGGPPVACFGYIKLNDKTRYTYFILFKADPKKHKPCGHEAVGVHGGEPRANLRITIEAGDTKFQYTYKIKADSKAGVIESESLTIGGTEYDKDIPGLFLVDLTQETPTCRVVKDVKIVHEGYETTTLEKTILRLKQNNEVKEFLEGKAAK